MLINSVERCQYDVESLLMELLTFYENASGVSLIDGPEGDIIGDTLSHIYRSQSIP